MKKVHRKKAISIKTEKAMYGRRLFPKGEKPRSFTVKMFGRDT